MLTKPSVADSALFATRRIRIGMPMAMVVKTMMKVQSTVTVMRTMTHRYILLHLTLILSTFKSNIYTVYLS